MKTIGWIRADDIMACSGIVVPMKVHVMLGRRVFMLKNIKKRQLLITWLN